MRIFTDLHGRNEPPLPDWDTPRLGEPAHGYVLRLSTLNMRSSLSVLLTSHGLNGRDIQPHECLAFALSFPMHGKHDLIHATPVVSPASVAIMGQVVRRRHWQIGRRRFCPACLAENPYHRAWWDLNAFSRCPDHDLDIVCNDPSGHPVPWWSPSFTHAPTGRQIVRYGIPRRPVPRASLERYVLGRLGAIEPEPVLMLDPLSTLGDVLDAVEFIGRVALGGTHRSRPVVGVTMGFDLRTVHKAGYALLAQGEDAVVAMLHDIAGKRTSSKGARGKGGCFGWVSQVLTEEEGSHVAPFAQLLMRVAVERGEFSPATGEAWHAGAAGWLPIPTLASELGLTEPGLRRIAEALGIHERQYGAARERYRAFNPEQADLVRRTVGTMLDRDGAAKALALHRGSFDTLVAGGIVHGFARVGRGGGSERFRGDDIDAFAARLLDGVPLFSGIPKGHVRLGDVRRTSKTNPSELFAAILSGREKACGRVGSAVGDLLVIDPHGEVRSDMAEARNALRSMPGMSRYEAATLFGCRVELIDGLVDAGLVTMASENRAWRRLDPASVEALRCRWAPVETYRDVVGHKAASRRIGESLEGRGVLVRWIHVRDGSTACIVDRASARTALGLMHDPDAVGGGETVAFETTLLRAIAEQGIFKLTGRSRGLTLTSGAGDLSIRIEVRRDEEAVVVKLLRTNLATAPQFAELMARTSCNSNGRLALHAEAERITVMQGLSASELNAPAKWPGLVERILASAELFRESFPRHVPNGRSAAGSYNHRKAGNGINRSRKNGNAVTTEVASSLQAEGR